MVTVNIFCGPAPSLKATYTDVKFWTWGPKTIWPNLTSAGFFFLKNYSTLMGNVISPFLFLSPQFLVWLSGRVVYP